MTPGGDPDRSPVVACKVKTREQRLVYTLVYGCGLPVAGILSFVGPVYGIVAIVGVRMILLTAQLRSGDGAGERAARHVVAFSIVYLSAPFAVHLVRKELRAHFWFS